MAVGFRNPDKENTLRIVLTELYPDLPHCGSFSISTFANFQIVFRLCEACSLEALFYCFQQLYLYDHLKKFIYIIAKGRCENMEMGGCGDMRMRRCGNEGIA